MTPENIEKLKSELRRDEGFRSKLYRCPTGHLTIGYGHNCEHHSREVVQSFRPFITRDRAERLLAEDIRQAVEIAESIYNGYFNELSDSRKRILVNMAFCLGWKLREFHNLRRAIIAKDWEKAADEILNSRFAVQTRTRAIRLSDMMRKGA